MLKWQIAHFVILKMTLRAYYAASEIWSLIAITAVMQILNDIKKVVEREKSKKNKENWLQIEIVTSFAMVDISLSA